VPEERALEGGVVVHTALHQRVLRTLRRGSLIPEGGRVLVGLSGGSDSVGLLLVLRDLAESGRFSVAGAAHFNHRARPTAERDEAFCRNLATRLDVSFSRDEADVASVAARDGLSFEECARQLRYGFLRRAARDIGATTIAVGHTVDDQAETFLLKLARGAGATGLGGVYPRRDAVVRPMLDVSRDEIRRWLRDMGQAWMDDESNADLRNPRNRVRHRVLPELDAAYGGPTRAQLARAADLIRADGECLDARANDRLRELARRCPERLELDAPALFAEPGPIRSRLLLAALREHAPGREIGLEHVESALEVLRGERRAADVPGSRVELRREVVVLFRQGDSPK
jgi:tRNA(Ile)-lysidine synthase